MAAGGAAGEAGSVGDGSAEASRSVNYLAGFVGRPLIPLQLSSLLGGADPADTSEVEGEGEVEEGVVNVSHTYCCACGGRAPVAKARPRPKSKTKKIA